jgi:hypothetical protein
VTVGPRKSSRSTRSPAISPHCIPKGGETGGRAVDAYGFGEPAEGIGIEDLGHSWRQLETRIRRHGLRPISFESSE